jgi:hypothetical protein
MESGDFFLGNLSKRLGRHGDTIPPEFRIHQHPLEMPLHCPAERSGIVD